MFPDFKMSELKAIVELMCTGQVTVAKGQLENFLDVCIELEVRNVEILVT